MQGMVRLDHSNFRLRQKILRHHLVGGYQQTPGKSFKTEQ
jgi:hypothetical protein